MRLGQDADLVVVAPATADLLARAAHGRADDLLTSALLTARCPVLLAPAMHTEMWEHPATRANVATLRERGVVVLDPASGRLTGADTGPGRLPEPDEIVARPRAAARPRPRRPGADLAGRHVVVSAGGTREPLDPVRFLGNRSSGRQGFALAAAAAARGARVTLVAANVELPVPAGVEVVPVGTAPSCATRCARRREGADVVVMAAAVADFRPARGRPTTRSRRPTTRTTPRWSGWSATPTSSPSSSPTACRAPGRSWSGFAAETGDDAGDVLRPRPAQAGAQGLRPARRQRRVAAAGCSAEHAPR